MHIMFSQANHVGFFLSCKRVLEWRQLINRSTCILFCLVDTNILWNSKEGSNQDTLPFVSTGSIFLLANNHIYTEISTVIIALFCFLYKCIYHKINYICILYHICVAGESIVMLTYMCMYLTLLFVCRLNEIYLWICSICLQ